GAISHGEMIQNDYGQIAEKQWHWLCGQYPYVVLHAFVIMPNHVHGIIEINRSRIVDRIVTVGTGRDLSVQCDLSLQRNGDPSPQPTVPKIKSLSEIIGAYKTTVSKQIHLTGYLDFAWQRSFYDNIIRNDESHQNIFNYILDNPLKWDEDEFYNNNE
ncbi:hypothetical protein HQ585_13195, partial [candidate division KSB1 bacterium]|nr:hypothetical protein [candidate division KSB1 bacterium]